MLHHNTKKMYHKNLNHLFSLAYDSEIEAGLAWYKQANEFAKELSSATNVSTKRVAAVISALSPAVSWDVNKRDAQALIETWRFSKESLDSLKVSSYGQNKRKAIRILEQGVEHLGHGPKTLAFYRNIYMPHHTEHVTIDRHAYKALVGIDKAGSVNLTKKEYEKAKEGYRSFAEHIGIVPCELQAIIWTIYKRVVGR